MNIYILHQIRGFDGEEDVKLIGVYSSRGEAERAVERLAIEPGFRDHCEGFDIQSYEVDKDHWTEGFVSFVTIYVRLLNEGTEVWRPVEAEVLGDDCFKIVSENTDPNDETWEFPPGSIVRCARRAFEKEVEQFVAIEEMLNLDSGQNEQKTPC